MREAQQQPVPVAAAGPRAPVTDVEMRFWESVERGDTADDYQAYLLNYPSGSFADLARNRLKSLGVEVVAQSAVSQYTPHAGTWTAKIFNASAATSREAPGCDQLTGTLRVNIEGRTYAASIGRLRFAGEISEQGALAIDAGAGIYLDGRLNRFRVIASDLGGHGSVCRSTLGSFRQMSAGHAGPPQPDISSAG